MHRVELKLKNYLFLLLNWTLFLMHRVELKSYSSSPPSRLFPLFLFLMHRVELKCILWRKKFFVVLVPNAPCGVEIYNTILFHSEQKHKFLMHRVELK